MTQLTREQVAKMSHQNPLNKILKILFKCFSRLEGPLASQLQGESRTLLCKLAIGASTSDQVSKMSLENARNPEILKNFLSIFRVWGTHLLESHESF